MRHRDRRLRRAHERRHRIAFSKHSGGAHDPVSAHRCATMIAHIVLGMAVALFWGIGRGYAANAAAKPVPAAEAHPLDQIPRDASLDEWLTEADGVIRGQLAEPKVKVKTLKATPQELRFEFSVAPEAAREGKIVIPLVVPRGEMTTAILERIDIDGKSTSEAATLGLIKVKAQELGYIRTFRIATFSLSFEPRGLGGCGLRGGVGTIMFVPPSPIRDLSAIKFWARNRVGIFRNLVQKLVANPSDVDRYIVVPEQAIPRAIAPISSPPPELEKSPFRMRIRVRTPGIYRITASDLESSGVVVTWLDPHHLRLFNNGHEVPMLLVRGANSDAATMQPDDLLLFYGAENTSRFSADNVYWLIYDESRSAQAMPRAPTAAPTEVCQSASTFLTKTVIEQDTKVLTRSDQFLSILGFRWIWHEIPTSGTFTSTFDLPGFQPTGRALATVMNVFVHDLGPATSVTICLRLNNGAVRRFPLASERDERKTFTIPEQEMRAQGNRFEIWLEVEDQKEGRTLPVAGTQAPEVYLDNFEIWYSRPYFVDTLPAEVMSPYREDTHTLRLMEYNVGLAKPQQRIFIFDVSGPTPQVVPTNIRETSSGQHILNFRVREDSPRRYMITTPEQALAIRFEPAPTSAVDLRSTATQADYLIIAYPDFVEPMKKFALRKEREGHKVLLVDTQTIYDQFAHGQETPEAIKRFIDYAARYYDAPAGQPPASYVLLVGDATSAYKNEFHNNVVNYVPSFTMSTDSPTGEQWASDHWYSRLFGTDDLADVFIGRLSVNNRKDLENILAKLEDYEKQRTQKAEWRSRVGFVADHTEFDAPTRRVAELMPPAYTITRLSLSEEPWEDNFYFPREVTESKKAKVSPEMTRKIRDLFNGGAAAILYFGHGSPNVWSTQRIWFGGDSENSDNLMLGNRDRLPVVLNMTCNSGAIDYPLPRWNVCISEDFLRVPNGGAIACYVPAGPGMASIHEIFSRELVRSLFAERMEPLGPALILATYRYLAEGNPPDLVRMFILLGDPSMQSAIEAKGGMFATGLGSAKDLSVRRSAAMVSPSCDGQTTVTISLDVFNTSEKPIRDAVFNVTGNGFSAESDALCFLPREKREVVITGQSGPGITSVTISARSYGCERDIPLELPEPVAIVVGGEETSAPLRVVPGSLQVRHTAQPYSAELSLTVANVGKAKIANLRAMLVTSQTLVQESLTTLPLLSPGESRRIELRRTYIEFPEREETNLVIEGESEESSLRVSLQMPVLLGKEAMADLIIPEGGIMPHKAPVVEGETVFFRVVVENIGNSVARNVRVDGYDGTTTGAMPLQSRVLRPYEPVDIAPHGRAVFTVRWDPTRNAGVHDFLFRTWCSSIDAERRMDNNERVVRMKVLTKSRLRPLGVSVLPLTEEDRQKRQLRLLVRIANDGEGPAHGVRVVVYADRRTHDRNAVLADDLIEAIQGKQVVERSLTYRLKEEDRGRRIEPWCEVFLKGSLQRVPWPE
ncbi:MAG: C25 family cysteine peptidase [Candidatus Sumerlaeaceae bacterium]